MPKVIFDKDYDYRPSADYRVLKAFKASVKPQPVNEECAKRAVACGAARLVEKPSVK